MEEIVFNFYKAGEKAPKKPVENQPAFDFEGLAKDKYEQIQAFQTWLDTPCDAWSDEEIHKHLGRPF